MERQGQDNIAEGTTGSMQVFCISITNSQSPANTPLLSFSVPAWTPTTVYVQRVFGKVVQTNIRGHSAWTKSWLLFLFQLSARKLLGKQREQSLTLCSASQPSRLKTSHPLHLSDFSNETQVIK